VRVPADSSSSGRRGGSPPPSPACCESNLRQDFVHALQQLLQAGFRTQIGARHRAAQLRAIDCLHGQVDQLQLDRRAHRLPEQPTHPRPMRLVEPPQRVVIRTLPAGQPQQRQLLGTRLLQAAGGRTPVIRPYTQAPSSARGA
jgi:hypothetical protein